jgi:hypothetical protein
MRPARGILSQSGWVLAIVALYGALVVTAPVLHHDFACHQKSPTHCVSCTSSPSAPQASARVVVQPALTLLGHVAADGSAGVSALPRPRALGRAPPA